VKKKNYLLVTGFSPEGGGCNERFSAFFIAHWWNTRVTGLGKTTVIDRN